MDNKKTIKINFCDWSSGLDKENNHYSNILKKYYHIEISDKPDFLIYSPYDTEHMLYDNCVKIFLSGENVSPNFNECDYAAAFDYMEFGDRYFRKNYLVPSRDICNRQVVSDDYFNRRFCNFIYSNGTAGEGAVLRQEFCKKLMEYKHVDCPGKVLNNMIAEDLESRLGDWAKSKREFLRKYKFTIAFENSLTNGYTTEKLIDPLQNFSIPIYWGNPMVTKDFNPKAFINCNDYDNDFDAVIERVKELDSDPDKYLAVLRENPMQPDFDFEQGKRFEQWLINIIERGNKPFSRDPYKQSTGSQILEKLEKAEDLLKSYEITYGDAEKNKVRGRIDILCDKNDDINVPFKINEIIHRKTIEHKPVPWAERISKYGFSLQKKGNFAMYKIVANTDINLNIILRGPDIRDENNKIIENWVDYTSLIIDNKELLSHTTSVWHNKPFTYILSVKKGDIINLHAEWKKHENGETQQ